MLMGANASGKSSLGYALMGIFNFVDRKQLVDITDTIGDEKFTFIHSDMEKAFLSVIIEALNENTQAFFTTHNTDSLKNAVENDLFSAAPSTDLIFDLLDE